MLQYVQRVGGKFVSDKKKCGPIIIFENKDRLT